MDKRKILNELIEGNERELFKMEVTEKYLMGKASLSALSGKDNARLQLGALQREKKNAEDFLKFLKDYDTSK